MKARPATVVQVHAADRGEWRAWLEKNHASYSGIALVFYKKASGKPCVTYDEAVEEALCLGWIDSRKNSLDAQRYTFVFSPRRAGSAWSKSNKARVESLIASGRMTEIGLAKIEAAKRDGSWSAFDAIENLTAPPALGRALSRNKKARKHFDALSAAVRKLLIRWIASAKRRETQERRIKVTVAAAARGDVPESFKRG